MKGALILGSNYIGLCILRSLGRYNIPVWVLKSDGDFIATASRYCRRILRLPHLDDSSQLEYLLDLANRYQIDGWVVFPTDDETAAFLARHHAELAKRFRLTTPPWEVLQWAYDKRLTYRLAADVGVDSPQTHYPAGRQELTSVKWTFPVILKPAIKKEVNRFTVDKAWRIEDFVALSARYDEACEFVSPDLIMVQELIPGGGEAQLSYGALCADGIPLASVTARRTRQYPTDFGHSSTLVETVNQPEIEESAGRLLAAMGYTGVAEVEFKYDSRDRRFKVLDINPRLWTWHALCRRAGVDFPYLLWLLARGEPVSELRGQPGFSWVRMSTDILSAMIHMLQGRLSPQAYARSLRGPIEYAMFASDDPLPWLLDLPILALRWFLITRTSAPTEPRSKASDSNAQTIPLAAPPGGIEPKRATDTFDR
jgi:predicted ATP-grasp superfamily ATP-dependent carboligase